MMVGGLGCQEYLAREINMFLPLPKLVSVRIRHLLSPPVVIVMLVLIVAGVAGGAARRLCNYLFVFAITRC